MNRKRLQKLHQIYDLIPHINCKGLCWDECSVIGMHRQEFIHLERVSGKTPQADPKTLRCNYLTDDNRCSVYKDRPLICRAWGVAEGIPCEHGCKPDKMLTRSEFDQIYLKIVKLFDGKDDVFNLSKSDVEHFLNSGAPEIDILGAK